MVSDDIIYIVRCSEMARDGFQPHLTKQKIPMCFHYSLQIIIIVFFDILDCKCSIMLYYYLLLQYHTAVLFFIVLAMWKRQQTLQPCVLVTQSIYHELFNWTALGISWFFPKSSPTSLLSLLGSFIVWFILSPSLGCIAISILYLTLKKQNKNTK